jgi:hypothetical protein
MGSPATAKGKVMPKIEMNFMRPHSRPGSKGGKIQSRSELDRVCRGCHRRKSGHKGNVVIEIPEAPIGWVLPAISVDRISPITLYPCHRQGYLYTLDDFVPAANLVIPLCPIVHTLSNH